MRFETRLCDSKTAYQIIPERNLRINLIKKRSLLDELGTVLAVTPYVAVLKSPEGIEFSVYSSGKILFRNFLDREKSEEIAKKAHSLLV